MIVNLYPKHYMMSQLPKGFNWNYHKLGTVMGLIMLPSVIPNLYNHYALYRHNSTQASWLLLCFKQDKYNTGCTFSCSTNWATPRKETGFEPITSPLEVVVCCCWQPLIKLNSSVGMLLSSPCYPFTSWGYQPLHETLLKLYGIHNILP